MIGKKKQEFVLTGAMFSKLKFNIDPTQFSPEDHIALMNVLDSLIDTWIDQEHKMENDDVVFKDTFLGQLKVINLKNAPLADVVSREGFEKIFSDSLSRKSVTRMLDLEIKINYTLPGNFVELIKGRIYATLVSFKSLELATEQQWYDFIIEYPFTWLLFMIKSRIIDKGDTLK